MCCVRVSEGGIISMLCVLFLLVYVCVGLCVCACIHNFDCTFSVFSPHKCVAVSVYNSMQSFLSVPMIARVRW